MTTSTPRSRRSGALAVVVAVMAMTIGVARAEPLKPQHQATVADCSGPVEWHFVHNQTDEDDGFITVGDQRVANGEPRAANVLHYWVGTDANTLPGNVADNVAGGKLVLSHYTCLASTSTTTTTEAPVVDTTSTTTTTSEAPVVDTTSSTTTSTTSQAPAVVDAVSTTTTTLVRVLSQVPPAQPAQAVLVQPGFTG